MNKYSYIRLEKIDLGPDGMHLKLQLSIQNRTMGMILDTGASATVFDLELMRVILPDLHIENSESLSAGLGTNSMKSFKALIPEISIGKFTLNNFNAALLDLSHINAAYSKVSLPLIQGVVGNDILQKFEAVIDYKKLSLRLKQRLSFMDWKFKPI